MDGLVINAKNILDLKKGVNIGPNKVLIIRDRIKKIGNFDIDNNWKVVDINNRYTLLPGLVDCHVHLCLDGSGNPLKSFEKKNLDEKINDAKIFLNDYLDSGITTIRDLGTPNEIILNIYDWIKNENLLSPDIISSGYVATIPEGHGLFVGKPVKSKKELKDFIDNQYRDGMKWIKFMASGGVHDINKTNIGDVYYTREFYKYAIDTAHEFGLKTSAHVSNREAVKLSVECGIDSIEHGTGLDKIIIEELVSRGIYLCPTISSGYFTKHLGLLDWMDDIFLEKQKTLVEKQSLGVKEAIKYNVNIVSGTDSGTTLSKHGKCLVKELKMLNEMGMSNLEALRTATINAAEMFGECKEKGNIEKDKIADLIVVDGDPLTNVNSLEQVMLVIKSGTIYKNIFV